MKLEASVNDVILSNVGVTGEFRIRNSAKAFSILSSGLYSNKIRAIVRELSCNAVDSHVAAGKADVPFEVHLPNTLEPWFSVKDFGLGLDNDQIVNIYTTYFESTKTDSNDFIGALGLGSKSPFSYTENFTIIAIKDGFKRIYSAFINEMGVPSVAAMSTELTDECNGVEVKFSVVDKYDYESFKTEARYVYKYFKLKPVVTGVSNFVIPELKYKDKDIVPGVHVDSDHNYHSIAIMGNIAYPLNKISEPEKHFGSLASLLTCNLIMEFGIGELDFAASREELSFIPLTIKSIKAKLEALNASLAKHIAKKADAIAGMWERAEFLYGEMNTPLYSAAITKYATDTKFPLIDIHHGYRNRKTFEFPVKETFQDNGLDITGFSRYSTIKSRQQSYNGTYTNVFSVEVNKDHVFVLNDLKTGCLARARYHFKECASQYTIVYCISHESDDLAVRQAAYDKFLKSIHNPPKVMKASDLEKKVTVKASVSTTGIVYMDGDTSSMYSKDRATWKQCTDTIDDKTTYYYVPMSNFEAYNKTGHTLDVKMLAHRMTCCGIPAISSIKIYGVRKSRIDEISKLSNWVLLEDKLIEETAKISDKQFMSMIFPTLIDSWKYKMYINKEVANAVSATSEYKKFVDFYNASSNKNHTGEFISLSALCTTYGKVVQTKQYEATITALRDVVVKKYPLLMRLNDTHIPSMVHYINLIDKHG